MVAEGHAELKSIVDAIPLDFPDVIIDAAGAKHGAGNAGIDGQIARENADALGSGHEDFIFAEQRFESSSRKRGNSAPTRLDWSTQPAERSQRQPPKRM